MRKIEREKSHIIIHSAAVTSGAAGALPIPGADAAAIVAAQVTMIISLGKVFDVKMTESAATAMATTMIAEHLGKMVAGGLLKLIPGVGSAINASVAFSITEVIGWEVAEAFSQQAEKASCTAFV
ncbi:Uncharacterized conserved protein, DUF697 family [Selenomonas ruminantium]|uniref:Uncharacterized conserved protein, DUF697 family n=1 Tax=Selenomonas ruminantium TaxID=971 RepID=A0A1I3I6C0_SELRU|nr:DUF697 domain-containing protein [Selenomonas ruminantium]SFI43471.1 Uncharacterized conserved protein, DUF697 family [Selenomonas ruminantium]